MKLVFLALFSSSILKMPAFSVNSTTSFPPLLLQYPIPFPGIISHLLSKHQCLPQQDRLPPSLPPSLTCSILLVALMCCLCWKNLLADVQNASFSSLKAFWATSFTLTPVTSLGQESGWDVERRKHSLLCRPTLLVCFPSLPFFYI